MTKEDKLKELDMLLLDKMILLVRDNKTDELPDLTAAINYVTKKYNYVLSKNNRVYHYFSSLLH